MSAGYRAEVWQVSLAGNGNAEGWAWGISTDPTSEAWDGFNVAPTKTAATLGLIAALAGMQEAAR